MPKLAQVEIWDTYGCGHVAFRPKTWTWISGQNRTGKSTIIRAIAYIFEGGTDPSVIRKGAEVSKVQLILDDNTVITKVTRPRRNRSGAITGYISELEVEQPGFPPMPAPKTFVEDLSHHIAVDPSILLRVDANTAAGRKQLAAEFTKLIPITFTPEEIAAAFTSGFTVPAQETMVAQRGADGKPVRDPETDKIVMIKTTIPEEHRPGLGDTPIPPEFAGRPLSIDDVKRLSAAITEQRRRIGQFRDDSDGAARRLKTSLPVDGGSDYDGALDVLEKERRDIEKKIADQRIDIERDKAAALARSIEGLLKAGAAVDADIDARIKQLEVERQKRKETILANADKDKELFNRIEREAIDQIIADVKPHQDRITAAIATATERRDAHVRAAGIREEIERHKKATIDFERDYTRLSEVLKTLEASRLKKLENLPIAGLVVEDGTVYLDGIEWQNVNLARRVEVVLQICTQLAGSMQLLLIDDCEHMDKQTRSAIEEGLAAAGWQVIAAVVSDKDGPLTIETKEVVAV